MVHRGWHWIGAIAVFVIVCIAAIAVGAVPIPMADVIRAIGGSGDSSVVGIVVLGIAAIV